MLGIYQGRASVRGGMKQWSPGGEGDAEIEFAEKLPGLTDEIKVTTDLGKHVTVARRRGENWYVASMSGAQAQAYAYPLAMLKPGKTYAASIYRDTPGSRTAAHTRQTVTAQTVIPITMEPNGGHLMIIEPAGPASAK
jgi:alpha-glucosidase